MTLGGKTHYAVESHWIVCGLNCGPFDVRNEDPPKEYPMVTSRWDLVTCRQLFKESGGLR